MVNLSLLDAEDISNLSDAQEKALSLIPIFPALLSCWGSGNIIYMVFRTKKCSPYRRILLGMSICDLIASLVYPWQSFLVPQETSQRIWAIGTDATCSGLGFMQQTAFSNIWYNGMLSVYFLLTVKFGVRQKVLAKTYEPWMHLFSIGYPLLTASIGAALGVYHEVKVGHGCWVTNYPEGCGCNELDEGECCTSPMIGWIFAGIPSFLTFVAILVNNGLVYLHVRYTIRKSHAYEPQQNHSKNSVDFTGSSLRSAVMSIRSSLRSSSANTSQPTDTDPQLQRIRAVWTQASLYVLAFLVTYTPSMTLRIMESKNYDAEDEAELFPLLIIQALVLPLAGFFNCLIYVRPSYLRTRREYPNETKWWAFRRALHGPQRVRTARPPVDTNSNGMEPTSSQFHLPFPFGRQRQRRAEALESSSNPSTAKISSKAKSHALSSIHETKEPADNNAEEEKQQLQPLPPDVSSQHKTDSYNSFAEDISKFHDETTEGSAKARDREDGTLTTSGM